jgi:hypothetical protein
MNPCAQEGVAPEPDAGLGQQPPHPESSVRLSCAHVYGRSAAVCAVCTETSRRDHTITLEFASAQDNGANGCHEERLFRLTAKREYLEGRLAKENPVTGASASVSRNGRQQLGAFLRRRGKTLGFPFADAE